MTRRLLNLVTVLSLLLCVAAAVLSVVGLRRYDLGGVRLGPIGLGAGSYRGHLLWAWAHLPGERAVESNHESGPASPQADAIAEYVRSAATWRGFGFSYTVYGADTTPIHLLITPAWSVIVLAAALPAARLRSHRRRRRRAATGLCPRCGYDLRATPGRCPECGHNPVMQTTSSQVRISPAVPQPDAP